MLGPCACAVEWSDSGLEKLLVQDHLVSLAEGEPVCGGGGHRVSASERVRARGWSDGHSHGLRYVCVHSVLWCNGVVGGRQVYACAQRCFMNDHMLYVAVVNLLDESALEGLKDTLSVSGSVM